MKFFLILSFLLVSCSCASGQALDINWKAGVFSTFCPGAGQYFDKDQKVRGVFIFASCGATMGYQLYLYNQYLDADSKFMMKPTNYNYQLVVDRNNHNRDALPVTIALYLVNIADAMFMPSDKVSLNAVPTESGMTYGVRFRW